MRNIALLAGGAVLLLAIFSRAEAGHATLSHWASTERPVVVPVIIDPRVYQPDEVAREAMNWNALRNVQVRVVEISDRFCGPQRWNDAERPEEISWGYLTICPTRTITTCWTHMYCDGATLCMYQRRYDPPEKPGCNRLMAARVVVSGPGITCHEVGHALGLWHDDEVFAGVCVKQGEITIGRCPSKRDLDHLDALYTDDPDDVTTVAPVTTVLYPTQPRPWCPNHYWRHACAEWRWHSYFAAECDRRRL